jgi:cobalt transport protein
MSRPTDETAPAAPVWVASLDPRVKVLYLLVVAVAIFAVHDPLTVVALAVAQVALAVVAGVGPARIVRGARRLLGYGLALAVTFAFFPDEGDPRWVAVPLLGSVSLGGLELAGLMMVRIFAVVVASEVVRSGAPSAFAEGLRGLGAPRALAIAIDVTVALLGPGGGGGRGGGRGRGMGRGRAGDGEHVEEGFGGAMRRLARGDVGPIVGQVERSVDRASHEIERRGDAAATGISPRDLAVVAGMATAMLGLKILKVLPGIPFAPGHKTVLLIPLYILAGALTTFRWGATLTGATMGTVAFLMGDGRYGVFEILKHIAPGVVVDLGLPWLLAGGRRPGVFAWCLFGLVVAIGRFATVVAMTLAVAAPGEMYVLLAVPGVVHLVFGVLSGFVSYHVVRGLDEIRAATGDDEKG